MKRLPREENQERKEMIIRLSNSGQKRKTILETIELTNSFPVNLDIIDNVLREYNVTISEDTFNIKKLRSAERSIIRLRNENTLLKRYDREDNKASINSEEYLNEIKEAIKDEVKPINIKVPKIKWSSRTLFSSTDRHLGKKNTDEVLERVNWKVEEMLRCDSDEILFAHTWDLFENLVDGWMHTGQVESMDPKWLLKSDSIKKAAEVLFWIFDKVLTKKKLEVVLVWGNHDRFTKKNEDDMMRMGMFTVAMMVEQRYRNVKNFKLHYNTENKVVVFKRKEKVCYYFTHWDEKLGKIEGERTNVMEVSRRQKYELPENFLYYKIFHLYGHLHSRTGENVKNITRCRVADFAGSNSYDERNNWNWNCWYLISYTRWETVFLNTALLN